jgi:hypothetical protein
METDYSMHEDASLMFDYTHDDLPKPDDDLKSKSDMTTQTGRNKQIAAIVEQELPFLGILWATTKVLVPQVLGTLAHYSLQIVVVLSVGRMDLDLLTGIGIGNSFHHLVVFSFIFGIN